MSWSGGSGGEEMPIETLFELSQEMSIESIEPPMDEWSSLFMELLPEENRKKVLYEQGLYHPGSGEICAKHICMSDSSVLRHPYYNYPSIKDPGIKAALLKPEPKKIFPPDGQELYFDLCNEMNIIPVRSFVRGLLNEEIDLKYYGVNPVGIRAMCLALANNTCVRRLDLTSNYLNIDACYHLGQLIGDSYVLQELALSGCKIGPNGLRQLVDCLSKRKQGTTEFHSLDLSKNEIGDEGFLYLADKIARGAVIKKLNLSNNNLTNVTCKVFAEAIEGNNTITHLDLSWNKFFMDRGINALLLTLAEGGILTELNLSWTSLTTSVPWKAILGVKTLQVLNLSFNRLTTPAVEMIASRLRLAKKLRILDLSHNRLTPADAFLLLNKMRSDRVKLKNLYMEDTSVTKEFMQTLKDVLSLPYRSQTTITYGIVLQNYSISKKDLRGIVMKRLKYLTRPQKKIQVDAALILLQAQKETKFMDCRQLMRRFKEAGMHSLEQDLIDEMYNCFPGPKSGMDKMINLDGVAEYVHRIWPDSKLPPTPPPEIPEPVVLKKKGKKKDAKKKK